MRLVDWNISYAGDTERKMDYLKTLVYDDMCVLLQEVKPHAFSYIKSTFGDRFHMLYSLEYRKPSKFDSDARRLGVAIMVGKQFEVVESGVVERSPFPDRTLFATIKMDGQIIKLLALRSLTGCGYYRTKSVQYDSFAEFIDEYHPDVIGIDANEPQIDHYNMEKMVFFDNGPGAKHFFDEACAIGLRDAFIQGNSISEQEEGKPLAKSHNIRRKGAVRYDFLLVKDSFHIKNAEYRYDEAVAAGSDHAVVLCEVGMGDNQ